MTTTTHTHSFVLYNAQGASKATDELDRLGLKVKPNQGNAMIRRAINLYLEKAGAMQVQPGAMLFVFPKANKEKIAQLENWIVANGGRLLIFDACGDMETVAASLHDQFDEYIDRMESTITKMQGQKTKTKALEQLEDITHLLAVNDRFMTDAQRLKASDLLATQ
jgi:hypothetical protein